MDQNNFILKHKYVFLAILVLVFVCIYFISCKSGSTTIELSKIDMTHPYEVTNQQDVKDGEYNGGKDETKVALDYSNVETEKFPIYNYSPTVEVRGLKTNLWVENISANKYSQQVVIVDGDKVLYISPVLDPGQYVDNQDLFTTLEDTTKGYEMYTYLYTKGNTEYNLYSVSVSTVTFKK